MAELVGGMTGALQGTVTGALNKGQSIIDKFFPPETRNELWAKFMKFTTEKPMFAARPLASPQPPITVTNINHRLSSSLKSLSLASPLPCSSS